MKTGAMINDTSKQPLDPNSLVIIWTAFYLSTAVARICFIQTKPGGFLHGWASSLDICLGFLQQGLDRNWQKQLQHFFTNTFIMVVPVVILTAVSSTIVAYGFARFKFPLKKLLFGLMMSTLMLPDAVIMIPRYILFKNFGWLNTYLPFYVPALLAVHAFFVYLLIQFFRGIPRDLDEAAFIDGCGSFRILTRVLVPLAKPAVLGMHFPIYLDLE